MEDPKYLDSKIYIVFSPFTDKVYIGSTYTTLVERFYGHKHNKDCSSKIIIEAGDADIKLLHNYPCKTEKELKTEEGRVMRLYDNRVNVYLPERTDEEKRITNNRRRLVENMTEEQKYKNKQRQLVKNMSQEQQDKKKERTIKSNEKAKEKAKNMTQEERDKLNKKNRERAAKKREAAKTNSLDVSN
tara:strand:+ start:2992 stop:3552 length:561 start_codon:yes stop_codon:yes gene_type:complete